MNRVVRSYPKELYLDEFKDEFRKANKYADSTDTISSRVPKKTGQSDRLF